MTRTIARSSIAPIFLAGGMDAVLHPQSKAANAEYVAGSLSKVLGTADDPVKLVRINGAVQLAAGTFLILGWVPRLSSTVLAASLVPTTLAGHRFWEETDPVVRAQQRTAFLKNCAMVGGLLLAAVDKNGAPSMRWRTDKAAHRVAVSANENLNRASAAVLGKKSKLEKLEAGVLSAAALFGRKARKVVEHCRTPHQLVPIRRLESQASAQTTSPASVSRPPKRRRALVIRSQRLCRKPPTLPATRSQRLLQDRTRSWRQWPFRLHQSADSSSLGRA
jgi:putative oxidoreductase